LTDKESVHKLLLLSSILSQLVSELFSSCLDSTVKRQQTIAKLLIWANWANMG
jgi:hypothetical protein